MVLCPALVSNPSLWLLPLLLMLLQVTAMPLSRESQNISSCGSDEYLSMGHCCKLCPAGMFVQEHCRIPHTQGQCEKCYQGTFTEAPNGLESCRLCSRCHKDQKIIANCSATSDQKCQCQTQLYCNDPNFPETCLPLSKCPQGVPVLQKRNSTANTLCNPSTSDHRNRLFLLTTLIPILLIAGVYNA
ncbi:tumor necrosis factor receptor superfamily member 22-like isoform X1 [Psammomys obesus]|uniref:tumor necrosis factor receptor superfamily member 22-like isoform X1 n=2 Tax=Psammomys obesus TaxID=48139 RepID=UPI0024536171|nr:tumor necrosis factor receptor superfamily member 22-like isoform X1 [Psammomys obesus]